MLLINACGVPKGIVKKVLKRNEGTSNIMNRMEIQLLLEDMTGNICCGPFIKHLSGTGYKAKRNSLLNAEQGKNIDW